MTVLYADIFSFGLKNILLVPDGIIVTNTCAIRTISFTNEFSQMDLVGPLIRCLYSRDAHFVESMNKLA